MTWCHGWRRCPGAKDGGSGKSPLQKYFLVEAYFPPISLNFSTQFHSDQHPVPYARTKTINEKLEESDLFLQKNLPCLMTSTLNLNFKFRLEIKEIT